MNLAKIYFPPSRKGLQWVEHTYMVVAPNYDVIKRCAARGVSHNGAWPDDGTQTSRNI